MTDTDKIFTDKLEEITRELKEEREKKAKKNLDSESKRKALFARTNIAIRDLEHTLDEKFSDGSEALSFLLKCTPVGYTQTRAYKTPTQSETLLCKIFPIKISGNFCIAMRIPSEGFSDKIKRPICLCFGTIQPGSKETFSPISLCETNIHQYGYLCQLLEDLINLEKFFESFLRANLTS